MPNWLLHVTSAIFGLAIASQCCGSASALNSRPLKLYIDYYATDTVRFTGDKLQADTCVVIVTTKASADIVAKPVRYGSSQKVYVSSNPTNCQ